MTTNQVGCELRITPRAAKEFVDMYVNNWTLDFGLQGREGIE